MGHSVHLEFIFINLVFLTKSLYEIITKMWLSFLSIKIIFIINYFVKFSESTVNQITFNLAR